MKKPLISIILSTYNGSKYIKESINSILIQTYSNFELIIINDCSTDNVEQIILEFKKNDTRVVYLKNEKNIKLTASLIKGLKLAKGKYIARIDDDDIWLQDKLINQVNFMESNLEYGLCGTSMVIIDEKGLELRNEIMKDTDQNIRNNFLQSNQFAHSSVLIRKSILDKVGYYKNKWNLVEDYELWLRIGTISKLHNLKKIYLKYRVLNNSLMRKNAFKRRQMAFKVSIENKNNYPNYNRSFILRIPHLILSDKIFSFLLKIKKHIIN